MPVAAIGGLAVGILGMMLWRTVEPIKLQEEEETLPNTSVDLTVQEEELQDEALDGTSQ